TEAEQSRLVELIIEIHLAFLDRTAKMQLVLASLQNHIIGVGEIVADEGGGGIVAKAEPSLDAYALNCAGLGLERQRHAEGGDVCRTCTRATVSDFAGKAYAEIVDRPRREDMGLMNQGVLGGDIKCRIRVLDQEERVEHGFLRKAIEFVTRGD